MTNFQCPCCGLTLPPVVPGECPRCSKELPKPIQDISRLKAKVHEVANLLGKVSTKDCGRFDLDTLVLCYRKLLQIVEED